MAGRGWKPDAIALAGLAVLVIAFFWDVLLGPRVLLPVDVLTTVAPWSSLPDGVATVPRNGLIADAILQNVAWKTMARDAFARGALPLWNSYEYAGLPLLAGGQSGALYPPGILFFIIPVERAYGPFLALHVYLAGVGTYALGRVLGARPGAAIVGALAFAFGGFLIASFTWPMVVSGAAWLPVLLVAVELIARSGESHRRPAIGFLIASVGACALALHVLAGHLEMSLYTGFSLGFYALGRVFGVARRAGPRTTTIVLGQLALMALAGLLIAAIQIIPFAELIGQNVRAGQVDFGTIRSYALPLTQIATFFWPDFYGNPSHHEYWSLGRRAWQTVGINNLGMPTDPPGTIWWGHPKNYVEAAAYLGLMTIPLALLADWRRWNSAAGTLCALALVSLALAFGSPLYALFFFGVPGVDQLHTPFRWILPFSVATATMAALGVERLARATVPVVRVAGIAIAAVGSFGVLGVSVVALVPDPFIAAADSVVSRSNRLRRAFADGDALLSYEWRQVAVACLIVLAFGIIAIALARRSRWALPALAIVLAIDLFITHYGFNTHADPAPLYARFDNLAIPRHAESPFRVMGFGESETLPPITGALLGIEDARGYDTVIPRRYVEYWSLIEPPRGLMYSKLQGMVSADSLASPLLRFMNVRYLVTDREIDSPFVRSLPGTGLRIYELLGAGSRATVVGSSVVATRDRDALELLRDRAFDPTQAVILTSPDTDLARQGRPGRARYLERLPERATLDIDSPDGGYLVIAEYDAPGWRARVDGVESPVVTANHAFRAIPVPAGRHTVETWYAPASLRLGAALSGLGVATVVIAVALALWRLFVRGGDSTGRRFVRNILTGMGAAMLNKSIDFAFAIVSLRLLNPEGVGRYAFAIVISGYLEIVSNFGLNALVIRDGARKGSDLGALGGASLIARLAIWASGLPLIVAALFAWREAFGLTDDTIAATLLLSLALAPGAVAATYSALFGARERSDVPSALTVGTTVVKVALGLIVLFRGHGIVGLAAVAVLGNVMTAAALGLLAHRGAIVGRLRFDRQIAWGMVQPGLPLMINHLLATMFFKIDVLLLQPIRGDRELGLYAAAYKFIDGLGIISSTFTFAVFPILARAGGEAPTAMRHIYRTSLRALVTISIPIALILTALAHPLMLAVAGPSYVPEAVDALRILVWFLPLSYANGLTQYVLIAAGRQGAIVRAFVIALVFNLAANAVAIPAYGYLGAAAVTVASEVALALPFGQAVRASVGIDYLRTLAPLIAAAVAAAAAFAVVESITSGIVALLAAAIVAAAIVAVSGSLDAEFRSTIARSIGPLVRRRQPAELA